MCGEVSKQAVFCCLTDSYPQACMHTDVVRKVRVAAKKVPPTNPIGYMTHFKYIYI